jgi:undecaprenyl-diphosphatase
VLVVVLVGVCLALGRRRLAVLVVAGPVAAGVATTVLKPVVDRTKDGDLAYPSGHMAAATALAVVAALLLVGVAGVRGWRAVAVLTTVPVLTGGTVGLAMTVTGYHYLTDAVGGFCIGVATVLGLALLIDRWPPRRATTWTGDQQVNGARNTPWPSCD